MRLIDADTIFPNDAVIVFEYDGAMTADGILKAIKDAPTVDAVPVVRCKDCKRFVTMEGGVKISFCDEYGGEVTENDYCSRAKRRESDAGN